MYFNKFPKIAYSGVLTRDITRKIAFFETIKKDDMRATDYVIKEGETIQSVAQDFYGSTEYDFILMLMNKIINPITDWPMTTNQFEMYIKKKYVNPDAVKEWFLPDGRRFPADRTIGLDLNDNIAGAFPVTFYQYEEMLNENKKRIRILRPSALSKVMEKFELEIKK